MVEGVVAVSLKGGTLLYHKVRQHSSNWPFLHPSSPFEYSTSFVL